MDTENAEGIHALIERIIEREKCAWEQGHKTCSFKLHTRCISKINGIIFQFCWNNYVYWWESFYTSCFLVRICCMQIKCSRNVWNKRVECMLIVNTLFVETIFFISFLLKCILIFHFWMMVASYWTQTKSRSCSIKISFIQNNKSIIRITIRTIGLKAS